MARSEKSKNANKLFQASNARSNKGVNVVSGVNKENSNQVIAISEEVNKYNSLTPREQELYEVHKEVNPNATIDDFIESSKKDSSLLNEDSIDEIIVDEITTDESTINEFAIEKPKTKRLTRKEEPKVPQEKSEVIKEEEDGDLTMEPMNELDRIKKQMMENLKSKEEAGSTISVYISAEANKKLKNYMKRTGTTNKSKIIDFLILSLL